MVNNPNPLNEINGNIPEAGRGPMLNVADVPEAQAAFQQNARATLWLTGLSGSGKTTLCCAVAERLHEWGFLVEVLDADEVRRTFNFDLGYSRQDREQNIRRIASLATMLASPDVIVLVAAITPYRAMRRELREKIHNFIEVYVNAPLATCIARDPKGLYRRALAGEITSFTGIDDPYEPPLAPDIECNTEGDSVDVTADKLIAALGRILRLQKEPVYAAR
jgi:adenylylsulfate kinase